MRDLREWKTPSSQQRADAPVAGHCGDESAPAAQLYNDFRRARPGADGSSSPPSVPPLAPAKFTGSLWLVGSKPIPECTTPTYKTCEGGVGVGATTYSVPIPMPPLRQQ
jgi:hypothetical protein